MLSGPPRIGGGPAHP